MSPASQTRAELLVEPEWLEAHRGDRALRIIDTRSAEAYAAGHIPGAVALGAQPWLKSAADPLQIAGAQEFAALMSGLGVGDDTTVVAYSDNSGLTAARLWWVLRAYGHRAAKVLDGGWEHWIGAGRPVSTEPATPVAAHFEPRPDDRATCGLGDLRDGLADGSLQVLDVRGDGEWTGAADPHGGNPRVGHLPGARHLEWTALVDPERGGVFRSDREIRERLAEAGIGPGTVVTHCQAAVRAAHTAFALTLAGRDAVRVYDGSMAEWSRQADAPLVVGTGPVVKA